MKHVRLRYALPYILALAALPGCALASTSSVPATATPPTAANPTRALPTAIAVTPRPAPSSTANAQAAIAVTSPKSGDTVSSPAQVTGTASVFEGTVQIRVRDATGKVIGQAVTTASQGAPGRGTYSAAVSYTGSGPGKIEVYSTSAKDGSEQNLVSVNVTLR